MRNISFARPAENTVMEMTSHSFLGDLFANEEFPQYRPAPITRSDKCASKDTNQTFTATIGGIKHRHMYRRLTLSLKKWGKVGTQLFAWRDMEGGVLSVRRMYLFMAIFLERIGVTRAVAPKVPVCWRVLPSTACSVGVQHVHSTMCSPAKCVSAVEDDDDVPKCIEAKVRDRGD